MKLQVSGGGHGSFVVRDEATGDQLEVNSVETGYSAVQQVAEWLNAKVEAPAPAAKKSIKPPKGDE
jgi:hypothetical protein